MNKKDYENMRSIKTADELPQGAVYCYQKIFTTRTIHQTWYEIYDKDFNCIDIVKVRYINAIESLIQIVEKSDNDITLIAYKRTPLNEKYDRIEKNDDTLSVLEAMADAVKPKSWK